MAQIDYFRRRTDVEKSTDANISSEFIDLSSSSTKIKHIRLNKDITAVLTRDHNEGVDNVILFTHYSTTSSNNIQVGDFITHDGVTYFAFMEYRLPAKVKKTYVKHKIMECNALIKFDEFSRPAAYIGSLSKFINTKSEDISYGATLLTEMYKPMVITANAAEIKVNTRFLLGTESFIVSAVDRLSNPGIMYLSVTAVPFNAATDDLETGTAYTPEPPVPPEVDETTFIEGQQIIFETYAGYFVSDPVCEILSRTSNEVMFICPYGIDTLKIRVKNELLEIVEHIYKVVV